MAKISWTLEALKLKVTSKEAGEADKGANTVVMSRDEIKEGQENQLKN